MRVRIVRRPLGTIDGMALEEFELGGVYETGSQLGCLFLAEGWAEPVGPESQPAARTSPPDTQGRVVLLVDDDADMRALLGHLLEDQGYRIVVARHGKEALQRVQECCPELIILDLNMPVMDGWQFLSARERLDARLAAIPVLLLSGSHDEVARESAKSKAAAFVSKPFDPDHLMSVVRAASYANASATA